MKCLLCHKDVSPHPSVPGLWVDESKEQYCWIDPAGGSHLHQVTSTLGPGAVIWKPSIEEMVFKGFIHEFKVGRFPYLRLGQAFYNYFNLHKSNNQQYFRNLYECDGDQALALIHELFTIH